MCKVFIITKHDNNVIIIFDNSKYIYYLFFCFNMIIILLLPYHFWIIFLLSKLIIHLSYSHAKFSSHIYHYHFSELIYFIYDKFLFIDHGTLNSGSEPASLLY